MSILFFAQRDSHSNCTPCRYRKKLFCMSASLNSCLSPCLQLDVGSGRPGRQVLEPPGHHDHLLLPVDHFCGGGGGHRHGLHHPPWRRGSEGGLWGQQETHDQLCRRPAGPYSVSRPCWRWIRKHWRRLSVSSTRGWISSVWNFTFERAGPLKLNTASTGACFKWITAITGRDVRGDPPPKAHG